MDGQVFKGAEGVFEAKKYKDLKEIVLNTKNVYGDRPAFKFKTDKPGELREVLYKDYLDRVICLSTALNSIGLENERIGVIGENRYEWEEAFLAIAAGTGLVVPLDKSLPEEEIFNLIERSSIKAIIFSGKYEETLKKAVEQKIGCLETLISMDAEESTEEVKSQKELIEVGKQLIKNGAKTFEEHVIDPYALGIMLFTSGTTSKSKAVMLSQDNICSNIYDIARVVGINQNDRLLSFLPLHHTFESTAGFLNSVAVGACVCFSDGIRYLADNIKEYKITILISVPLLFESMYKKVMQKIEAQGKMKKVSIGIKLSNALRKIGIDKRRIIFKELLDSFGGELRMFISGAAAIDKATEKGFTDIGIDTFQGYGLTETSPVVAVECAKNRRLGSIGKLFPSLEGKVVDKNEQGIGELAVKGPSVMLGYYNNEEATKEVLSEDGWFKTGDLGYFDKDGYFFITGRKKDVIVLKNGKNVYPEEIEILINRIPGIKESYVYGKPDPEDPIDLKVCAKVVYDTEIAEETFGTTDEAQIKEKIWKEIKEKVNKIMPTYKYIKELTITDKELIKTTTQKIKRFEEYKTVVK